MLARTPRIQAFRRCGFCAILVGMEDSGISGLMQFFDGVHPIGPAARDELAELAAVQQVPARHVLQEPHSRCRTLYFLQTGAARIHYSKDHRDVTEYFALAPAMIIRAESLFTRSVTPKGIEVLLPSQVVSLPAEPFFDLASRHLDLERLFHLLIRRSYLESLERLEQLHFQSATERYALLLASAPEVVLKLPLKHVASYLGIAQVSLSRIRAAVK